MSHPSERRKPYQPPEIQKLTPERARFLLRQIQGLTTADDLETLLEALVSTQPPVPKGTPDS